MDPALKALIEAPLADPLKINLPMGRRSASRGSKPLYEDGIECPKLTGKQMKERREDAYSTKLTVMLDYYSTTTVPFERIAGHLKLDAEKVREAMERRGRVA